MKNKKMRRKEKDLQAAASFQGGVRGSGEEIGQFEPFYIWSSLAQTVPHSANFRAF